MPTTETTENSTATAPSETSAPDVMALANQADAATLPETTEKPEAEQTGTPAEKGAQQAPEVESKKADQKPEEAKAATKPESTYTKAQKEAARLADSWKKLDAEKAELRKRDSERDAELKKLQAEIAELRTAKPKKESDVSADDYEALAKEYETEGNTKLAAAAREKAAEQRAADKAAPQQSPAAATESWKTPEFQHKWQANVAELIKEDPELAKAESPLVATANNLVNHEQYGRFLRAHPDGIKMAVEVARLIQTAQQVGQMQEKLTKAQAEVERLTKATALKGSVPAAAVPPKKLTDMAADEAEALMKQLAAAADRGET